MFNYNNSFNQTLSTCIKCAKHSNGRSFWIQFTVNELSGIVDPSKTPGFTITAL